MKRLLAIASVLLVGLLLAGAVNAALMTTLPTHLRAPWMLWVVTLVVLVVTGLTWRAVSARR